MLLESEIQNNELLAAWTILAVLLCVSYILLFIVYVVWANDNDDDDDDDTVNRNYFNPLLRAFCDIMA